MTQNMCAFCNSFHFTPNFILTMARCLFSLSILLNLITLKMLTFSWMGQKCHINSSIDKTEYLLTNIILIRLAIGIWSLQNLLRVLFWLNFYCDFSVILRIFARKLHVENQDILLKIQAYGIEIISWYGCIAQLQRNQDI